MLKSKGRLTVLANLVMSQKFLSESLDLVEKI